MLATQWHINMIILHTQKTALKLDEKFKKVTNLKSPPPLGTFNCQKL
jgi:hypothetical protein